MGINLDASRAKMEEQSAAVRAQLEVELSKSQEENRRLKQEHEQFAQDAKCSEKERVVSSINAMWGHTCHGPISGNRNDRSGHCGYLSQATAPNKGCPTAGICGRR
eukprot:6329796-Amphidinium_carterae.3